MCIKIEEIPEEQDEPYFREKALKSLYVEDESMGNNLQRYAFNQEAEDIEEKYPAYSKSNCNQYKTKLTKNINRIKKDVQINKSKSQENLFEFVMCAVKKSKQKFH